MPVNFRRLFIFRKDLHMSTGKLLAQLGHCAEGYWTKALIRSARHDGDTYRCQVNTLADMFEGYVAGSFVKTVGEARNMHTSSRRRPWRRRWSLSKMSISA